MVFFLQILANYAGLIYLACAVGVVLYVREIVAARLDRKQSLYSLEREAANARASRGVLMILALIAVAAATYVMSTYVTPTLATAQPETTPTPPFTLTTETPTPTFQPSPTRTPRATLTPTGQAPVPIEPTPATVESPTPAPPPLPPVSCPDPNVQIVAPAPGQTFNGSIQLRGTADAPNFAFYKFTLKGPVTNDIAQTVGEVVREPRRDAVLGTIDGASLLAQPGAYVISLIVVDNTGNELPACSVPVIVQP